MSSRIAYPGTFDPITRGHESLLARAAEKFDKVVIAVAVNVHKRPFFSIDERLAMCSEAAAVHDNVEVHKVPGLLADYLRGIDCSLMLRGIRTMSDFEVEMQFADINRKLGGIETLFMAPANEYIHVYSSLVREISELGGDVGNYVSPRVGERLRAKFARLRG